MPKLMSRFPISVLLAATLLIACYDDPRHKEEAGFTDVEAVSANRGAQLDIKFSALLEKFGVITAGAGVIKNGELIWTGYYGHQSPGVAASKNTLFDVASITKTVTAETILRLVAAGHLSLDESIAPYWVDPDLVDDPRHVKLTARMALTHSTGFLNWRFFADDGVLRLLTDPGTTYGYSGEGIEYVARYAENKLEKKLRDPGQRDDLRAVKDGKRIV